MFEFAGRRMSLYSSPKSSIYLGKKYSQPVSFLITFLLIQKSNKRIETDPKKVQHRISNGKNLS